MNNQYTIKCFVFLLPKAPIFSRHFFLFLGFLLFTQSLLNGQIDGQPNRVHFFSTQKEAASTEKENVESANSLVTYGHFTFIPDMEGTLWVGGNEYQVVPNQPTTNIAVPEAFSYSFVTEDKQFITQELRKKIHPSKEGEQDTIFLNIKSDFDQFILNAQRLKQSESVFSVINENMVSLEAGIAISKYEVTYQQYAQFIMETGTNKEESTIDGSFVIQHVSSFTNQRAMQKGISWKYDPKGNLIESGENLKHPVVNVSWYEAQQFCQWLSAKDADAIYRLPTIQEWEKAAQKAPEKDWQKYANLADRTLQKLLPNKKVTQATDNYALTSPVGTYKSNQLGLYDMYGNIAEWTAADLTNTYIIEPRKVVKGGSYFLLPSQLLSKRTYGYAPSKRHSGIGFRVVRERAKILTAKR